MKNFIIFILFAFIINQPLFSQPANKLFQQYSDSLDLFEKMAFDSSNKVLSDYLQESGHFLEAFKKEKNDARLLNYNIKNRLLLRNEILRAPQLYEKIILSKEQVLYDSLTMQRNTDDLTSRLKARSILANRKYYEKDDDEKGTIIELFLNGYFTFTSTNLYDLDSRYYGIKPWEINARLETIGFLEKKEISGILFSLGALYNIFPDIEHDSNDVKIQETLFSEYIKRTGIKFGIGGRFESDFLWHLGLGWQIRAFSIWSLYSLEKEKISFAVGINDLSWVKLVLPQVN